MGEAPPGRQLRRSLGVFEATVSGVGIILGAGIYALIGPASALAGNALWLAFVLAGAAAAVTAHAYARLGPVRARNAPEFQYTGLAFGPRTAFVAGWLMLATNILGAGAVALGFAGYLEHLTGVPWLAGGGMLVAVSTVVALVGTRQSVWVAALFTLAEAAGLLLVAVLGASRVPAADLTTMPQGLWGVGVAASLVFFAYIGFGQVGNLAEEMRHPERDLPRALYLAVALTGALYVATALSASAVVGWERLSASDAPLALVAGALLGPRADAALSVVALAATGNTVLLLIVSSARSVQAMAADGMLPAVLGRVEVWGVPAVATLAVAGIVAGLYLVGSVRAVAELTNGAVLASMALVNLSLLRLAASGRLPGSHRHAAVDAVAAASGAALCLGLMLLSGVPSVLVTAGLSAVAVAVSWGRSPRVPAVGARPG